MADAMRSCSIIHVMDIVVGPVCGVVVKESRGGFLVVVL